MLILEVFVLYHEQVKINYVFLNDFLPKNGHFGPKMTVQGENFGLKSTEAKIAVFK